MDSNEAKRLALKKKGYSERDAILVSMKKTKADKKAEKKRYAAPTETSDYGLTFTLDNRALDKLDFEKGDLPKVGAKLKLVAEVVVKDTSSRQDTKDYTNESMTLQITKMGLK